MTLAHEPYEPLRIARDELVVVSETDPGSIPAFVDRFRDVSAPIPIECVDHLRKLVTAIIQKMEFASANGWPSRRPMYFHVCRLNDLSAKECELWEDAAQLIYKELHACGWTQAIVDEVEWQNVEDEGTERYERSLVINLFM
ncbi:MAG: hypothetical protein QY311_03015 [Candidatus Paceibacterota bacterium]|nr:MAG: hypothetical protein QY311_03015 [Candidatus Paceibacterota bacterium]